MSTSTTNDPAQGPDAALLTGIWAGGQPGPNGLTLDGTMALQADGTFKGEVKANGQVIWTYAGTWQLNGWTIALAYLESSRPLPENFVDTDDIQSVDGNMLVMTSRLSGKQHTFVRLG